MPVVLRVTREKQEVQGEWSVPELYESPPGTEHKAEV